MFDMWSSNLLFLLYSTSGGLALIPFAASGLVWRKKQFWGLAIGSAAAAGILNVVIELARRSDPSENILFRDIAAIGALAFACPTVSASIAVWLARRGRWTRTAVATAVVASFAPVAPLFVLAVHCTSGDCL
jgi:hypothetical protein